VDVTLLGTGKMGTAIARKVAGAGFRGRRAGAAMPVVGGAREPYAMAEPEHGKHEMTAVIEMYPQ
jgi:predicted dinucleotide-binding enzyme